MAKTLTVVIAKYSNKPGTIVEKGKDLLKNVINRRLFPTRINVTYAYNGPYGNPWGRNVEENISMETVKYILNEPNPIDTNGLWQVKRYCFEIQL